MNQPSIKPNAADEHMKKGILDYISESRIGMSLACIALSIGVLFYPKWVRERIDAIRSKTGAYDKVLTLLVDNPLIEHAAVLREMNLDAQSSVLASNVRWLCNDTIEVTKKLTRAQHVIKGKDLDIKFTNQENIDLISFMTKVYPSYLSIDLNEKLDADMSNMVVMETPYGQIVWHVHEDELMAFDHLDIQDYSREPDSLSIDKSDCIRMCKNSKINPHIGSYGNVIAFYYETTRDKPVEVQTIAAMSGYNDYVDDLAPRHMWIEVDRYGTKKCVKYTFEESTDDLHGEKLGPSITDNPQVEKKGSVIPLQLVPTLKLD